MDSNKIWWTAKSRIQTEQRLIKVSEISQYVLMWYSFCSIAAAIFYLKFEPENQFADIIWVEFAILVFSASIFIQYNNYKERAALVKECYIRLQSLFRDLGSNAISADDASKEYDEILAMCENHIQIDHYKAICDVYLTSQYSERSRNTKQPTLFIATYVTVYEVSRLLVYVGLFIFPLIIFLVSTGQ